MKIKKIIKLGIIIGLMVSIIPIQKVNAIEHRQIVYCDLYKGRHRVVNQGSCTVYNRTGTKRRFKKVWGYYKCACGKIIFCSDHPDADSTWGIPGYYIETSEAKDAGTHGGKGDYYLNVENIGYSLWTDLKESYSSTELSAYYF